MKKKIFPPADLVDFKELPPVIAIRTDGFVSQWCCDCGARHIWHFSVVRDKTPEDDIIVISCFGDESGTKLRKFYERHKRRRGR